MQMQKLKIVGNEGVDQGKNRGEGPNELFEVRGEERKEVDIITVDLYEFVHTFHVTPVLSHE